MRFFEPAEYQPCYYCKRIESFQENKEYPVREGIYTYEGYVYRCSWHARFSCSKCGEEYHFSWLYWCPKTKELVSKLNDMSAKDVLIVTDKADENLYLAARNLHTVDVRESAQVDPMSLVAFDKTIITSDALKAIEEKLA